MKERPIIFNSEMVRAILEGRKMQTRRVINPQPTIKPRIFKNEDGVFWSLIDKCLFQKSPFGTIGDKLWVRETWRVGAWDENKGTIAIDYKDNDNVFARREWLEVEDDEMFNKLWIQSTIDAHKARIKSDKQGQYHWKVGEAPTRWRSSIHMPRWASRIGLENIDIRVERLKDITEEDARDEGVEHPDIATSPPSTYSDYKHKFKLLWDSINAKHGCGWDINPWVWAIEFKKL